MKTEELKKEEYKAKNLPFARQDFRFVLAIRKRNFEKRFLIRPHTLLCGVDGSDAHHSDVCAGRIEFFESAFINIPCSEQKLDPISRFICFFQGNLKLCDEIRFSVRILRFSDIRADGSAAPADLV